MKKHIYKIIFTIIWTIIGLWLTIPVDNGREIGDMWMDGGDLRVKTGEGSFDLAFFAIMMIPVIGIWLWSLFKDDTKKGTVKRRSRMM